jgi:hypothetical protein
MCWLFHKWGQWGRPYVVARAYLQQRRVCERCGKVEDRNIGMTADSEDCHEHDDSLTPSHPWERN